MEHPPPNEAAGKLKRARLLAFIILWYGCSWWFSCSIADWYEWSRTAGQDVLSTHLVLMVFMFGGNTLVCLAVLALHFTGARYRQGGGDAQDARATLHANVALLMQQWRSTAVCVALGIVGTLLTYQVYQVNSVAVVQLLRCLGPAFTATLAFGFLRELLTLPQQLCLIVSLVGSMVATASDASFTPVACLVGVAMNTVFSLRNIQLRFLVVTLPQGVSKDLIIVLLTLAANVLGFALAFLFNLALYAALWESMVCIAAMPALVLVWVAYITIRSFAEDSAEAVVSQKLSAAVGNTS
ncbi:hypothetical protein Rsub_12939 [Raphidocelis subcapitata]|uniref:Uncharacterized protein n=1 Tax=Raphidocelis subcapitata TaxID=307507 RepID=A0A2V0PJ45_9CHLO|nr:hypothetical protein Rsub_12939 [Raphidocelis subcapitata]|eukprot:GBF99824.1 hypothetical protein Rsub_12939 [Raphidocelis subcapitata]